MEDLLLEDERMEELYNVMDNLLDLEFQIKAGTKDSVAEIVAESFYFIRGDRSRETGSADERIYAIYEGKSERNYSLY